MNTSITVKFDTPIQRGEQTITEVVLNCPTAATLRGSALTAILNMDVDTLAALIPRISTPALLKHDIFAMNPSDTFQLAATLASFLLPRQQLDEALALAGATKAAPAEAAA